MKTKFNFAIRAACHSFGIAVCAGAALLICASAPAQNLFVSDSALGNIYQYTPGGVQSTFASGLIFPEGLAFNSAGNLFLASSFDGNIYEYTPGGTQSTFASGLGSPYGLAFNSAGHLFVADAGPGNNINEYTPGGMQSTFASLSGSSPYGLAFDNAGNLFVAAQGGGGGSIYKITPGGVQTTFATGFSSPYDLAFNSAGDLFVADNGNGTIKEYDPSALLINTFSPPNGVWGLAFDSTGNLFASDGASNIYEYTPNEIATDGAPDTFASDLFTGTYLAFQPGPQTVPEQTSTLGLLAIGFIALLARRRCATATLHQH